MTQVESGGGLDFSELPRNIEKTFKFGIRVFLKETKTFPFDAPMCVCMYFKLN